MTDTTQAPKVKNEFAGLTKDTCGSNCNEQGCVISGKPYCAHPFKGGLHSPQMQDRSAIDRFDRAKRHIARQKE